jgi:3-oxoacyl-(acyl-carrier-protein) synthase
LAEVVGYGTSADAYHLTAGPEDGSGAQRAMSLALAQAGISPAQVQHLNAHATSTPIGDLGELAAIKAVFGTDNSIAVTSTKSATGHLLGAAGGIIRTLPARAWTSSMVRHGRWLSNTRCPMVSVLAGSMPACCSSAGRINPGFV